MVTFNITQTMYIDLLKLPKNAVGIEINNDNTILVYYRDRGKRIANRITNFNGDKTPRRNGERGILNDDKTPRRKGERGIKDPLKYRSYLESHNKKIPKWLINLT